MIKLSRAAAAAAADSDRWRRVTRRRPSAEDAEGRETTSQDGHEPGRTQKPTHGNAVSSG